MKQDSILLASPSKNRLDFTIGKVLLNNVHMFVEPQDFISYKAITNLCLIKHKHNDKGFGYCLNSIINYANQKKYKYVLFADDDIFGLKTRTGKKLQTEVEISQFLSLGQKLMLENHYAQMMVSFSGHNWYVKPDIVVKESVGCWGMIFLDVQQILNAGGYDEELKIFNDWDMSAKLLLKGCKTACWYEYQFEHKMKSKKGGAFALYQNNHFMAEQCAKMVARYGGNNVKMMFHKKHQQFEIRFNWKNLFRRQKGIANFFI